MKRMKIKSTVIIGIVVSAVAAGLAAEVAQTHIASAHQAFKKGTLLKIKSGGEVIAELRLLKPARVDINGIQAPQTAGSLVTAVGGNIEITPEGLSPWRISGAGLEAETVEFKGRFSIQP
jgi:hypothetical protein